MLPGAEGGDNRSRQKVHFKSHFINLPARSAKYAGQIEPPQNKSIPSPTMPTMTSRERVLSSYERRGYDRIPVKHPGTLPRGRVTHGKTG